MKKCSRAPHSALTQLNITPLLDLAFVLLVIFILTTTPIVSEPNLKLPATLSHPKDPPRKANFITLQADGTVSINNRFVKVEWLTDALSQMRQSDPDLTIIVRGDAKTPYHRVRSVLAACQEANVLKVDLATDPSRLHP